MVQGTWCAVSTRWWRRSQHLGSVACGGICSCRARPTVLAVAVAGTCTAQHLRWPCHAQAAVRGRCKHTAAALTHLALHGHNDIAPTLRSPGHRSILSWRITNRRGSDLQSCLQDTDGAHGRRRQAVDNNLIKDQIRKQLCAPDGDGGLISDSEDEDELARCARVVKRCLSFFALTAGQQMSCGGFALAGQLS